MHGATTRFTKNLQTIDWHDACWSRHYFVCHGGSPKTRKWNRTNNHCLHRRPATLSNCCECYVGSPRFVPNLVPRLGGMHFLTSFIDAVSTLMCNTGLTEIMQTTFGSVLKILSGKKLPQNMLVLRIVTEEILLSVAGSTWSLFSMKRQVRAEQQSCGLTTWWRPVFLMTVFHGLSERLTDLSMFGYLNI